MTNKFASWLTFVLLMMGGTFAFAKVVTIQNASVQIETATENVTIDSQPLPFRWDNHFVGDKGRVTYTIVLPASSKTGKDKQMMALYAPRVGNQVQVRLNGEIIWQPGQMDDLCLDASKAPMWATFSDGLLRPDRANVIEIQTVVQAIRWAGLSEMYMGTAEELRPMYRFAFWWTQTTYVAILAVLLVMGLIAGYIWREQRDELYGFFALSAFFGALSAFNQIQVQAMFLSWPLLGVASSVALAWHVIFMSRFALGMAGNNQPWIRLALLASVIVMSIAYLLAHPLYWTIAIGLIWVPAAATLIVTAKKADQEKTTQIRWLFVLMLILTLTAMRDIFVVHLPESGMSHFAYLPHALFLFALWMGWVLARRYTQQHALYHELNITLEERVAAREQALASSFETIASQGAEKARLLERQRIMSDIHDGVGGQLVGLVNMIKRGEANQSLFDQKQLSEHAQMALDELRVAIDAMQPVNGDLATVLATLRYRLAPRLKASDIELVWRVDELPVLNDLTPQKVLQIQRILLEAFTNILKHSQAKTATLTAHHCPVTKAIKIKLIDDGIGFDADQTDTQGHGLRNMRFRAQAIDAAITLQRSESGHGMTMTLVMPNS